MHCSAILYYWLDQGDLDQFIKHLLLVVNSMFLSYSMSRHAQQKRSLGETEAQVTNKGSDQHGICLRV
jgi:hypothetical protein